MIIEKVVGYVQEKQYKNSNIQWLTMPFDHAHKRVQRFKAQDGREFGIRLLEEERVRGLKQGDILFYDKDKDIAYAINVEEEPVLIIKVDKLENMGAIGYIIGNRHAKLYQGESSLELVTPYEKTLEEMLKTVKEISIKEDHRKLLAEDDLMSILPQGERDHDHDHEYEHDHD